MGIGVYLNTQCFLIQSGEHTTVVCHIHYYDSSPTQNYVHCIIICITECSSCLALHVHTPSKMVVSLLRVVLCVGLVLCGIDHCGQCQSYDSITHEPKVSNGQDRNDDSEVAGYTNCPTWTLPVANSLGRCKCGSTLGGIVKCDPETLNISVQVGYCITYDPVKNETYAAQCPYDFNSYSKTEKYTPIPHSPFELNSAMCGSLNRQGRACGECKPGHGPGVFSADFKCYRCSGSYHGWGLYLLFELFPITLLFLFIMLCHYRCTAASINGFLFFSQLIVAIYQFYPPDGSYPFGNTSNNIIRFYLIIYGFWNLDYFRQVVPPFCVSEHITGLYMNALLYVAVFYLLLLTLLAYVLIEMHARSYRVVVCLWRPFHKYYVKVHRNVNPRNSLIDAFTTSLILSYSRLMLVSFNLLHPLTLYIPDGSKVKKSAVYYDGSIDTFSHQHVPFVVLSLTVLFIFNLLPAVFLFVYPMKLFQKILGKSRKCTQVLHPLADNFQGCYRWGTNDKWDYRCFAGLYMILRGAVFIGHITRGPPASWLLPGLIFSILALLFANLRPYRNDIFNTVDSLLFASMVIFTVCQAIITTSGVENTLHYEIITQLIIAVPLIYITGFIFHRYIAAPLNRRFCQRERQEREGEFVSEPSAGAVGGDLPYRMLEECGADRK